MQAERLAVDVSGLVKRYGSTVAVDGLDVRVPTGTLVGFVGPNGAGKSTTMRMLLGLTRPDAGSGTVLGAPLGDPAEFAPRVGAMVDAPAFYKELSGRANLETLAVLGDVPRSRIEIVLDQVGLGRRADDLAGGYSMGMRQRLGIAAALLPDPELLILDEPTNGLDPAGIIEMRDLFRLLRDEGCSVFISSHHLAELEHVSDELIVINRGRLLFAGSSTELASRRHGSLTVAAEDPDDHPRLIELIGRLEVDSVTPHNGRIRIQARHDVAAELNRVAMAAGITLVEMHHATASLEESFLEITEGSTP